MKKYYKYNDETGLICKKSNSCPEGFFTTPLVAIRSQIKKYEFNRDQADAKAIKAAEEYLLVEKMEEEENDETKK